MGVPLGSDQETPDAFPPAAADDELPALGTGAMDDAAGGRRDAAPQARHDADATPERNPWVRASCRVQWMGGLAASVGPRATLPSA